MLDVARNPRREADRGYISLHNATIEAIAEQEPRMVEELAKGPSVSNEKLARDGASFIEAMRQAHK